MIYTKEQILEKYNTLPQDVREAVFHSNLEKNITEIGEKNGLRIDQIGELLELAQFVMFGIVQSKDFIRELYERLGISDKQKVRDIAHEVNLRIFQPIRESLMLIHNANHETGNIKPETPTSPSAQSADGGAPDVTETKEEVMEEIEKEQPVQNQESTREPLLRRETETKNTITEVKLREPQKSSQTFSTYSSDDEEKQKHGENKPLKVGYSGDVDPYREPVD